MGRFAAGREALGLDLLNSSPVGGLCNGLVEAARTAVGVLKGAREVLREAGEAVSMGSGLHLGAFNTYRNNVGNALYFYSTPVAPYHPAGWDFVPQRVYDPFIFYTLIRSVRLTPPPLPALPELPPWWPGEELITY